MLTQSFGIRSEVLRGVILPRGARKWIQKINQIFFRALGIGANIMQDFLGSLAALPC